MTTSKDPLVELREKFVGQLQGNPGTKVLGWYLTEFSPKNSYGERTVKQTSCPFFSDNDCIPLIEQFCLEALVHTGGLWESYWLNPDDKRPIQRWISRIVQIRPDISDILVTRTTVRLSDDEWSENSQRLTLDERLILRILNWDESLEEGVYTIGFQDDLRLISAMAIDVAIGIRDQRPMPIKTADLPTAVRPISSQTRNVAAIDKRPAAPLLIAKASSPALETLVTPVTLKEAARILRERRKEIPARVCELFDSRDRVEEWEFMKRVWEGKKRPTDSRVRGTLVEVSKLLAELGSLYEFRRLDGKIWRREVGTSGYGLNGYAAERSPSSAAEQ